MDRVICLPRPPLPSSSQRRSSRPKRPKHTRTPPKRQTRRKAGSTIENYIKHIELLDVLGVGSNSMGIVFRAYDAKNDREIALKWGIESANSQLETKTNQRLLNQAATTCHRSERHHLVVPLRVCRLPKPITLGQLSQDPKLLERAVRAIISAGDVRHWIHKAFLKRKDRYGDLTLSTAGNRQQYLLQMPLVTCPSRTPPTREGIRAGLSCLHRLGIDHRDQRSDNVLCDRISDFGSVTLYNDAIDEPTEPEIRRWLRR